MSIQLRRKRENLLVIQREEISFFVTLIGINVRKSLVRLGNEANQVKENIKEKRST